MKNTTGKITIPTKFSDISTPEELILYLDNADKRLRNSEYLYHYTTISNAINIIHSGTWHLGNAEEMNDKLEYENGDPDRWNNLFFSSFMCEDKENIGMWSMYAQPWETGVKISIPRETVLQWIKETKEIWEISTIDYRRTGQEIPVDGHSGSLRLSSVAYSNADSLQKGEQEKIRWSTRSNTKLKNATRIPELTGYIKDIAWSYEKELRIKAEFNNRNKIKRVAIPLNKNVIKAMVLTSSPLFEGDLKEELEKESIKQLTTRKSIFTKRLDLKTVCQECKFKKGQIVTP